MTPHGNSPHFVQSMVDLQHAVARTAELKLRQYRVMVAVIVALAVALGAWGLAMHERAIGRRTEHVRVLRERLVEIDSVFVVDSGRAADAIRRYDAARVHDAVRRGDDVYVPRAVADDAVNACRAVLHDCGRARAVADSIIAADQDAARPRGLKKLLKKIAAPAIFVGGLITGAHLR